VAKGQNTKPMKKITAIVALESIQDLADKANMPEPQRIKSLIANAQTTLSVCEFVKMAKLDIQVIRAWASVKGHESLKTEADKFLAL
jgi:acetoacetate decarboxylase